MYIFPLLLVVLHMTEIMTFSYYLASFILCADGGANRYYDLMKSHGTVDADVSVAVVN
jgi:general stress protein CsbA